MLREMCWKYGIWHYFRVGLFSFLKKKSPCHNVINERSRQIYSMEIMLAQTHNACSKCANCTDTYTDIDTRSVIHGIQRDWCTYIAWWRHQMGTFPALLALCTGNSPVIGEFPSQRPVTRSFDIFFDLRLNKLLSKQPRRRWFETPSRSLWRHCIANRNPNRQQPHPGSTDLFISCCTTVNKRIPICHY